jgi:hypothetical protein
VPERGARPRSAPNRTKQRDDRRRDRTTTASRKTVAAAPARRRHARRPAGPDQDRPVRPSRRAAFDPAADERHERFTLIEFVWEVEAGIQPVILAERKLLH